MTQLDTDKCVWLWMPNRIFVLVIGNIAPKEFSQSPTSVHNFLTTSQSKKQMGNNLYTWCFGGILLTKYAILGYLLIKLVNSIVCVQRVTVDLELRPFDLILIPYISCHLIGFWPEYCTESWVQLWMPLLFSCRQPVAGFACITHQFIVSPAAFP